MTAVPTSPIYERTTTLFKSVVEDPGILSTGSECLNKPRKRVRIADTTPSNDNRSVKSSRTQNGGNASDIITGYLKEKQAGLAVSKFCAFCMGICKHTYVCKKCGYATHCSIKCYRADWYRHKFSCKLGRKIDATDYLMLACHANEFPFDEDVANKYGFMSFTSGYDRSRLFNLYRRLVIDWNIDEDELRSTVQKNKLKETLIYRCLQTGDPRMLREAEWLKSEKEFRIEGKGPRISVLCEAAQMELLSPKEKNVPILELEPVEKRQALVFYIQIQNGFIPDIHEENWISLGFCTTTGRTSTDQLALAYESLVARCSFDEFWNAIADSRMVELFRRYRLTNRILHIRNFKYLMGIVKRWHQSVWELKRFAHTNATDPHRAVEVDYGFANCRNARQRMQLRKIYQEYFKRGEDEMRLHKACISGTLGSFLESVLGSLGVCRYLLQNPYPLEDFPLAGMVAPSVIVCTESMLDQVMALEEVDEKEILVIPDSMDEEMTSRIHERATFLGRGMRKRRYPGHEGRIIMDLSCP